MELEKAVRKARRGNDEAFLFIINTIKLDLYKTAYAYLHNREDDTVVVDTSTEEILKQPKGKLLSDLEVIGNDVWFKLKTEKEFNYSLFMLSSIDAKGNEYNHGSMVEGHIENGMQRMGIRLNSANNSTNIVNPLTLKISAFPQWINGDAQVKVK
ncbi:MAG: hypothetical protein AB2374_11210 [Cytobacillus gottheilii]|uniref:hypothetical protein n=1 Tax=Cytobacillus gottheilii TaxID=859144 RepID=UPI003464527B